MPSIDSVSHQNDLQQLTRKSVHNLPELLNVLIVDDHPIIRWGMKLLINDEFPDATIVEAGNAQQAHACLPQANWSIILLDISLPRRSGLELLAELKRIVPHIPVLMLTVHSDGECMVKALKGGASGYLTKDEAPAELITAIQTVIEGEKYISQGMTHLLIRHISSDADGDPFRILSDREYEVLQMLTEGQTPTEISIELTLSIKTISTYRSRILEKLCLKNNSELMRFARRHGMSW